jgi:hypothetical protein
MRCRIRSLRILLISRAIPRARASSWDVGCELGDSASAAPPLGGRFSASAAPAAKAQVQPARSKQVLRLALIIRMGAA